MCGALFFVPFGMRVPAISSIIDRVGHGDRRSSCSIILVFLLWYSSLLDASAQSISGSFVGEGVRPASVTLLENIGGEHLPLDSVGLDRKGRFRFPKKKYPAGFYRLSTPDGDPFDLILDPREQEVIVRFDGTPLQEHAVVLDSDVNKRLWEYKWASRDAQAKLAVVQHDRSKLAIDDEQGHARLDSIEMVIAATKNDLRTRLIEGDPLSPFARLLQLDQKLQEAVPNGASAIARAMDWDDPVLLRSSSYARGIMAYLQALPDPMVEDLSGACDSIMTWATADTACWRYSRYFLVRTFVEYGPDMVAQHMVDKYVTGTGSLVAPGPELLLIAQEMMKVSIGALAPDVTLVDPVQNDSIPLENILAQHRYTALFFYSSSCDHCHGEMPGLLEVRATFLQRGFEVVGVALDADLEEFVETLEAEQLVWPSYSELIGWGCTTAKRFSVKSTPNYFLLDTNGRIVAKPYNYEDLRAVLTELLR